MNIETLKVFRDLTDTESFSKTAELNYISQSAVSQQIKKLELVLKCKLYRRQTGRILLTPCGEKFYEASRKITSVYDGVLKGLSVLAEARPPDEVRVSSIYSAGIYMIQNYIKQFISRNPGAKISLKYRQFSQIYPDITSGRADFGFMACPCRKAAGLAMRQVASEEMVLVAGPTSPLAGRSSVTVKELAGQEFIFFDRVFPSRRYTDAFLRSHGVRGRVKMEFDNIETIKTAVSSGSGVSLLPRSVIRDDEAGVSLHTLSISDARFLRPIYLVYGRERKFNQAAKNFMGMFDSLRKIPGGTEHAKI